MNFLNRIQAFFSRNDSLKEQFLKSLEEENQEPKTKRTRKPKQ